MTTPFWVELKTFRPDGSTSISDAGWVPGRDSVFFPKSRPLAIQLCERETTGLAPSTSKDVNDQPTTILRCFSLIHRHFRVETFASEPQTDGYAALRQIDVR